MLRWGRKRAGAIGRLPRGLRLRSVRVVRVRRLLRTPSCVRRGGRKGIHGRVSPSCYRLFMRSILRRRTLRVTLPARILHPVVRVGVFHGNVSIINTKVLLARGVGCGKGGLLRILPHCGSLESLVIIPGRWLLWLLQQLVLARARVVARVLRACTATVSLLSVRHIRQYRSFGCPIPRELS